MEENNQPMIGLPEDTPTAFGEYKVSSYISHGSYGHVYHVFRSDDGEFALKWLRADAEKQGSYRFKNEIWALEQLDHPAIPKLFDQGEHEGRPYFVMSLAKGTSLRSIHNEQLREGGASAQMRLLAIVAVVLDALATMHAKDIFHRDVKDDNIIVTDSLSQISLIDLGFCRSEDLPTSEFASFWNVGAARYSPPSKLNNPSRPHATHDVFAVGVVAYLLLTNRYPWDVGPGEDVGKLREHMLNLRPLPVHDINSLVDRQISLLIEKLIVPDDDARPSAAAARDEIISLQKVLGEKGTTPQAFYGRGTTYHHVARDPVHGDVRLTDYEWKILRTREFQRLRGFKQLGFANLVYLGAEHTRMSHAIGTLHVVEKIMQSIEAASGISIDLEKRLSARCYALVHDISHIPFGHTIEDELSFYKRHDQNRDRYFRLFLSEKSEIGKVLNSTSFGREALALLNPDRPDDHQTDIAELVEGSTGADVLDYIDRDSYFCGLDHRVDSALFRRYRLTEAVPGRRIQQHLISRIYGAHGFRLDAEFALESILMERFAIFMKVYTHPAKVAAGAMLGKAIGEGLFSTRRPDFDESNIEFQSDAELLLMLRSSRRQLCKDLAERLLNRRLFKAAFRARALGEAEIKVGSYEARIQQFKDKHLLDPTGRIKAESELAKKSGGVRPGDVVIYVTPQAPGLQKVSQYIEREQGRTVRIDEVHNPYENILSRHLKLWTVYVFVPVETTPKAFNEIGSSAEAHFGLLNEITMDRRQGVLF